MRLPLTAALAIVIAGKAFAGEFGDAAIQLENKQVEHEGRLQVHDGTLGEIDLRLQALEDRITAIENQEPPPVDPQVCLVTPVEAGQDPFPSVPNLIPGHFEAEDFDLGGMDIAYWDTGAENVGLMYRTAQGDAVDIKATGDTLGGNFQVGWIYDGEWLEFTVCAEEGTYDVWFRVASKIEIPGSIRLIVDGELKGEIAVPSTGTWDTGHVTIIMPGVVVRGGNQIVRLEFFETPGGGSFLDLNWFKFVAVEQTTQHIFLDPQSVDENLVAGVVGILDTPDFECPQYSIDDPRFIAVGDTLRLADGLSLDHEAEPTVNITVTAIEGDCLDP